MFGSNFWVITAGIAAGYALIAGGYGWHLKAAEVRTTTTKEETMKIEQKEVIADENIGVDVQNTPREGSRMPPLHVKQERILANKNTGVRFGFDPQGGPIQLDKTVVEDEHARVEISPDAVTIDPRAGTVEFIKKGN